ncbi:MAG: putative neutral zinc metallopeptidase [Gemmataceae bacterium]|nr:putative neutral zinc metallopeptidase [Gemmataceae bacterium]
MQWEGGEESSNVEDRRGMGTPLAIGGGIGGVVLLILGLIFGVDFGGGQPAVQNPGQAPPANDKTRHFVAVVTRYTEEVWTDEFAKKENEYGVRYHPPEVVLFSQAVDTGCGRAPSAVGPFYCPEDEKVYLDPTFFDELERKLGGSKAEFSQAYVIAHEVGHHVQKLLGYNRRVGAHDNQASVRLELMADYLAGVWANHGQQKFHFIEPGDVEAALNSARAIGDDRLQKRSGSFVHPENFTHGTSRQRVYFFQRGLKTGDAKKRTLDKFFNSPIHRNGEIEDF